MHILLFSSYSQYPFALRAFVHHKFQEKHRKIPKKERKKNTQSHTQERSEAKIILFLRRVFHFLVFFVCGICFFIKFVRRLKMTRTMDYEETELRLGLPGGNGNSTEGCELMMKNNNGNKRGFSETVDLKLKLASKDSSHQDEETEKTLKEKSVAVSGCTDQLSKPPAKTQVVGWPPVRSFRKNTLAVHKNINTENEKSVGNNTASAAAAFVKVSVDGAPYLRKVDLKIFKSYQDLSEALSKMFSSFTIGNYGSQEFKDFMNESKLIDLLNGSDYVPTYEDKDGDWMLVGDVPWEMFVDSCKRLRIMKGSEAIGLAPRAVEKCKNRI